MGFFMKRVKFEKLQQAFIEGFIDLNQFIEVLVDNLGPERTKEIIEYNIKLAMEKECTNSSPSETESL